MPLNPAEQEKLLSDAAREMDLAGAGTITIEYTIAQAMGLLGTLHGGPKLEHYAEDLS